MLRPWSASFKPKKKKNTKTVRSQTWLNTAITEINHCQLLGCVPFQMPVYHGLITFDYVPSHLLHLLCISAIQWLMYCVVCRQAQSILQSLAEEHTTFIAKKKVSRETPSYGSVVCFLSINLEVFVRLLHQIMSNDT